jgi:hypothetical protein
MGGMNSTCPGYARLGLINAVRLAAKIKLIADNLPRILVQIAIRPILRSAS